MVYLGLDVGDKTVGVAKSDTMAILASGVTTIRRENVKKDIAALIAFINEWEVQSVVVGLPLNMNGTEGPQVEKTRAFIKQLKKKIMYTDHIWSREIEIVYWDERLSTKLVEKTLIEADVSRAKRKKVIDKLAAVTILQGYLDAQRRNINE